MTIEELKLLAEDLGEKPFRGKQIFIWLNRGVTDFDEMTDLSKQFREKLKKECAKKADADGIICIGGCRVADVQKDEIDGTKKFLFECSSFSETDAQESYDYVEGVFMKYKYGNSLCVSSQVGCRMGCKFCASALGGFLRNLTAGEMLGQVLAAEKETGENINHIVVMGMGEPFDNYDNVAKFLRLLHDPDGKNMSYRNMTVSTSGIIPGIRKFATDFPQANLAISLHRLTDKGRSEIMPVNRKYPVSKLLDAAKEYTDITHRRITFEYTLISGENDTDKDVQLLRDSLAGMLCHVNLIPLNEVKETNMHGSTRKRAEEIAIMLDKQGIATTVRRELGKEIDGACGQLRLKSMK